jgi:hypothetical protein
LTQAFKHCPEMLQLGETKQQMMLGYIELLEDKTANDA